MNNPENILEILEKWKVPLDYKIEIEEIPEIIERNFNRENPEMFQRNSHKEEFQPIWDITANFLDKKEDISAIAQENRWVEEEVNPVRETHHNMRYGPNDRNEDNGHAYASRGSVYQ